MAKNTVTTAKNIRGLQVISPEGVVGVWQDKKDSDRFFVAITTKAAGWSEFTNRAALVGPLSTDEMLAQLASYKKRGEGALAHVVEVLAGQAVEAEAELVEAALVEAAPKIEMSTETIEESKVVDPLFEQLLVRAQGRTVERNEQLVVEVTAEIGALRAKLAEITGIDEAGEFSEAAQEKLATVTKLSFNLHRKELMLDALGQAIEMAKAA